MVSVLFSARSTAMPTSAISSDTPVKASPILTWASAAVYWALIVSLWRAEGLDLGRQLLLGERPACPARPGAARAAGRGSASCSCTPFLRSRATRARSSRFCWSGLARLAVELARRSAPAWRPGARAASCWWRRRPRRDAPSAAARAASRTSSRASRAGPRPCPGTLLVLALTIVLNRRMRPIAAPVAESKPTPRIPDPRQPVRATFFGAETTMTRTAWASPPGATVETRSW